jgi:hypothetical protein
MPLSFQSRAKDRVRPDPRHRDSFSLSGGMRIDDGQLLTMPQSRTYERLEPPAKPL